MEKNYRVLRQMPDSINTSVAKNFQPYLLSLDFSEEQELETDMRTNSPGLFSIEENNLYSTDFIQLMRSFDLFYYMDGRFPLTTGHLYIPDGKKPEEVANEYINRKNPYEQ